MNLASIQHHESHHACVVSASEAQRLEVCCRVCGGPMEAALLTDCIGLDRRLLMFRCPTEGATGQLRFTRGAGASVDDCHGAVTLHDGQAGYQHATCSCGQQGVVNLGEAIVGGDLVLVCGLHCGVRFELHVPIGADFHVGGHHHA